MKKSLCVLWELDAHSHARLEQLSMAASGKPFLCASFHPHITLGCYEQIEDRQLRPWLRSFSQKVAPFAVRFMVVGLLATDRVACFPAFTGKLRSHYLAFHQRFDDYADQWTRQSGGLYTPHVSLFQGPITIDTRARLDQAFSPFGGRVEALSLSWIKGPEDYQVVGRYELSGER